MDKLIEFLILSLLAFAALSFLYGATPLMLFCSLVLAAVATLAT